MTNIPAIADLEENFPAIHNAPPNASINAATAVAPCINISVGIKPNMATTTTRTASAAARAPSALAACLPSMSLSLLKISIIPPNITIRLSTARAIPSVFLILDIFWNESANTLRASVIAKMIAAAPSPAPKLFEKALTAATKIPIAISMPTSGPTPNLRLLQSSSAYRFKTSIRRYRTPIVTKSNAAAPPTLAFFVHRPITAINATMPAAIAPIAFRPFFAESQSREA